MKRRDRYRRIALYVALTLALALLALDRTAAYIHRPGEDSPAVIIYTTAWCPYCRQLRAFLDANDVPYSDYDIERSFSGGMGFWTLRGRGVPVAVVGTDIIHGLDIVMLKQALRRLGYETGAPPSDDNPGQRQPGGGRATRL